MLAARLDAWCDCGHITNREQVETSPSLLLVWERNEYPYRVARTTRRPAGPTPACAPCEVTIGAVCAGGLCRLPETGEEWLRLCALLVGGQRSTMCYSQAAAQTFLEQGAQAALQVCDMTQDSAGRSDCGESLDWFLLNRGDAPAAVAFCLQHLPADRHSHCVKTAAETLAATEPDKAVQMCGSIRVDADNDRWQQDACYHNIACMMAQTDPALAEQLCALISGGTGITEQDCLRCIASERSLATPLVPPEPTGRAAPTAAGPSVSPLPSPTSVP